jgi:hypothetical protein
VADLDLPLTADDFVRPVLIVDGEPVYTCRGYVTRDLYCVETPGWIPSEDE